MIKILNSPQLSVDTIKVKIPPPWYKRLWYGQDWTKANTEEESYAGKITWSKVLIDFGCHYVEYPSPLKLIVPTPYKDEAEIWRVVPIERKEGCIWECIVEHVESAAFSSGKRVKTADLVVNYQENHRKTSIFVTKTSKFGENT